MLAGRTGSAAGMIIFLFGNRFQIEGKTHYRNKDGEHKYTYKYRKHYALL